MPSDPRITVNFAAKRGLTNRERAAQFADRHSTALGKQSAVLNGVRASVGVFEGLAVVADRVGLLPLRFAVDDVEDRYNRSRKPVPAWLTDATWHVVSDLYAVAGAITDADDLDDEITGCGGP